MANGRWQMADGRWQMANFGFEISYFKGRFECGMWSVECGRIRRVGRVVVAESGWSWGAGMGRMGGMGGMGAMECGAGRMRNAECRMRRAWDASDGSDV